MEEARTGKRFPIHLPVRLSDGKKTVVAEQLGTTDNMSAAGIYVVAEHGFEVGSVLRLEMTIPKDEIGASEDMTVRCQARVMRNEEQGPKRTGIACVIDSYEFVRPGEEPEA